MRKVLILFVGTVVCAAILLAVSFSIWRAGYPRPYRDLVKESGIDPHLVYAVIKAESNFDETAKSSAGAIGLMQLLPSTAEFISEQNEIPFEDSRLTEGEYNVRLGCLYLNYLFERFRVQNTALAAYNAGEGTVVGWLKEKKYSHDGETLKKIPYPETKRYIKKVEKFFKIYRFLYH